MPKIVIKKKSGIRLITVGLKSHECRKTLVLPGATFTSCEKLPEGTGIMVLMDPRPSLGTTYLGGRVESGTTSAFGLLRCEIEVKNANLGIL